MKLSEEMYCKSFVLYANGPYNQASKKSFETLTQRYFFSRLGRDEKDHHGEESEQDTGHQESKGVERHFPAQSQVKLCHGVSSFCKLEQPSLEMSIHQFPLTITNQVWNVDNRGIVFKL